MKGFARKYAYTRICPKIHTYPASGIYFSVVQEEMGGGFSCTDQFLPTPCLILILLTNQKDDRLFLKRGRVLVQT